MTPPAARGADRDAPAIDGRTARRQRNRESVVEAIVTVINEGDLAPSMAKVADVAGVSERSVFRHFDTLEALFAAVIERQLPLWREHLDGVPPTGSLTARVESVALERSKLYEAITPVRKAAQRYVDRSETIRAHLAIGRKALRQELEATFDGELKKVPAPQRRDLLAAAEIATAWSTWNTLREQERCSVARARRITALTLGKLLA